MNANDSDNNNYLLLIAHAPDRVLPLLGDETPGQIPGRSDQYASSAQQQAEHIFCWWQDAREIGAGQLPRFGQKLSNPVTFLHLTDKILSENPHFSIGSG